MLSTLLLLGQTTQPADGPSALAVFVAMLGILGFVLACASLGWQVWTYLYGKKPRVRATASFHMGPLHRIGAIHVRVWNAGRAPVYIEDVALGYTPDRELHIPECTVITERGREVRLHPEGDISPNEFLAPGQGRTYAPLHDAAAIACSVAANLPEDKVSVAIRAEGRVLLRLPGERVHYILKEIMATVDRAAAAAEVAESPEQVDAGETEV